MKPLFQLFAIMIALSHSITMAPVSAQSTTEKPGATITSVAEDSLATERGAVEANVDDMKAHQAFIKAAGLTSPVLEKQYNLWMKKYPKSITVPLAIGTAYYNAESPKAKEYLLKVVEMDPKHALAYQMLSFDAERWGNEKLSQEYMGKAAAAAPDSPGYSFYYAMDFEHSDPAQWRTKLYELAKRFPKHERGAQGLYWLAVRSRDVEEKFKVFELLRTSYPPDKFSWSESGMSGLYDLYLQYAPEKAVALAAEMPKKSGWPEKLALANKVMDARALITQGKLKEANEILKNARAPRFSDAADMIVLLKAEVANGAGNTQAAYDTVVAFYAKTPSDETSFAMDKYGAKLGKTKAQIEDDVWKVRKEAIKPAPGFNLGLYTSDKSVSLEDYRGKVILLTFWFPGCGPCRGEFPHFENVLQKFKGREVAYLGINVFPDQDDYVLPFMKGTKYTFTPLRATSEWAEKVYKVRGEPTNFLIDQKGQMVFTNFRASDPHSERMLELMISGLLEKKEGNGPVTAR